MNIKSNKDHKRYVEKQANEIKEKIVILNNLNKGLTKIEEELDLIENKKHFKKLIKNLKENKKNIKRDIKSSEELLGKTENKYREMVKKGEVDFMKLYDYLIRVNISHVGGEIRNLKDKLKTCEKRVREQKQFITSNKICTISYIMLGVTLIILIATLIMLGVTYSNYRYNQNIKIEKDEKIFESLLAEIEINIGYLDEIIENAEALSKTEFLPLWRLDTIYLNDAIYVTNNDSLRLRMIATLKNITLLNSLLEKTITNTNEQNEKIDHKKNAEAPIILGNAIKQDLNKIKEEVKNNIL